jgi:hypothetical protein
MNNKDLLSRLIPESTISKTLTSKHKFHKENQLFSNKRQIRILNKRTFIYTNKDSSVQFHYNLCSGQGRLIKREIGETTEWLDNYLKKIKFVLWKESFNFRKKNFGIEVEENDSNQIQEETDPGKILTIRA